MLQTKDQVIQALKIALTLALIVLLVKMPRNPEIVESDRNWDFRSYYIGATARNIGSNPYQNEDLVKVAGSTPFYTMAYHPYTLPFFQAFTLLPYEQALQVYRILGATIFAIGLSAVALRLFNHALYPSILAIVTVLMWNDPLVLALEAGNTAIYETPLLWTALLLLLSGNSLSFLFIILVLTFFKGTPILLAPLYFMHHHSRKDIRPFAGTILLAALIFIAPYFLEQEVFRSYWRYASTVREAGRFNPCIYSLITKVSNYFGIESLISNLIWLIVTTATLLVFLGALVKYKLYNHKPALVFLSILTYALIVPRFKDYAYLQLFPVIYFIYLKQPKFVVACLCIGISSSIFVRNNLSSTEPLISIFEYVPLLMLFLHWCVLLSIVRKSFGNYESEVPMNTLKYPG